MTFRLWSSHRVLGAIVPPWTSKPFAPFKRAEERLARFSVMNLYTLLYYPMSGRATATCALRLGVRKTRTTAVRDCTMSYNTLHTDARRSHVVERPRNRVLDNDMSSRIIQSGARRLRLTEHPGGDAQRPHVVERPFPRVLDDMEQVCCQGHGSIRGRKTCRSAVRNCPVASSTVKGCA